ncbi:MAG TPA: hypothetical protein VH478_06470, partial [Trebonia sp.]|nr:hypothetical protein [Trebonia sp.]
MTATTAGDPAMEDPAGLPRTASDGTGAGNSSDGGYEAASYQAASYEAPGPDSDQEAARPRDPDADRADRIAAIRDRLVSPMPADRLWGWIGPLLITAFAGVMRFYRLSAPHAVIFDETYYVKDAWSILKHGVEWNAVANPAKYPSSLNYANQLMLSGHTNIFAACSGNGCGEYVVQPEVGKYLIAVGEWLFGLNPFGWRVASAFFGTLAILVMCRIARRLTR